MRAHPSQRTSSWAAAILGLALALLGQAGLAAAPATRPADAVRITLLHVNDVHGQLEGKTAGGKGVGGYGRLATAVADIRRSCDADGVLLIHAGDEFSKGDELTTRTRGRANVAIMNHVGFDLWVPGNGEFYDGLDNLRQRISEAKCQVLSANVHLRATGQPPVAPWVVREVRGVRVAFLGLGFIREEHPSAQAFRLLDPVQTARKLLPDIRKSADVVVAITHIGFGADQKLAATVGGIDLIIGGHSHTTLPNGRRVKGPDGEVLVCQAGDELRFLGRIDLSVKKPGGAWKLDAATAKLLPLDQNVKIDPTVTALIARLAQGLPKPATAPAGR